MSRTGVPELLYHYFDESSGPFRSLGDLSLEDARARQSTLTRNPGWFASGRSADYVDVRFGLEERLRARFTARGGRPQRDRPHYLTLGRCDWLLEWYPNPAYATIELDRVDPATISFTYGDLFPAMRWDPAGRDPTGGDDDEPARASGSNRANPNRGRVFLRDELPELIRNHGLPQDVNPTGACGPLRYVEAQLWSDEPLSGIARFG